MVTLTATVIPTNSRLDHKCPLLKNTLAYRVSRRLLLTQKWIYIFYFPKAIIMMWSKEELSIENSWCVDINNWQVITMKERQVLSFPKIYWGKRTFLATDMYKNRPQIKNMNSLVATINQGLILWSKIWLFFKLVRHASNNF